MQSRRRLPRPLASRCLARAGRGRAWSKALLAGERAGGGGADRSARRPVPSIRRHLRILERVCEAVAFAHSRGIVHRDLKPSNVMVGEFGEVLVMDWGIAIDLGAPRAEDTTAAVGSPAYLAPEMAAGQVSEIGPWTDVYLLGGTLYEVLTGTPPHRGRHVLGALADAGTEVEPAEQRAPDRFIDPALAAIAARALAPSRDGRYPNIAAFANAVAAYLRHQAAAELADAALREAEAAEGLAASARRHSASEVYGRFEAAIASLARAVELWPDGEGLRDRLTRVRAAHARFALGRGDLALAEAELARMPAGGHAWGTQLRADIDRAREAARRSAQRRRGLTGVGVLVTVVAIGFGAAQWRRAASAEEARRRRQEAQAELTGSGWAVYGSRVAAARRAVEVDPGWAGGWAELGRVLYQDFDAVHHASASDLAPTLQAYAEAERAFERAVELGPDLAFALVELGYLEAHGGRAARAREHYARAAATKDARLDDVDVWDARGVVALFEGRYADAAAAFGRAIDLQPQVFYYFERGIARYAAGDSTGALEDGQRAIELGPDDEWHVALYVLARLARGELRAAGVAVRATLAEQDEAPHLLPLAACYAAMLGDAPRAEALLERARAAHAKYARLLGLAPWYRAAGAAPGRAGAIGRALTLDVDLGALLPPEPAPSVRRRREAEARAADGDATAAMAIANRVLAEDPADGAAYLVRARALLALGHVAGALEDLALAGALAPERLAEVRALQAEAKR